MILRSRPQLSLSALLIGEMSVLTLVSLGGPLPFEVADFSTLQLALYIAVVVVLVSLIANLYFRPDRASIALCLIVPAPTQGDTKAGLILSRCARTSSGSFIVPAKVK